MWEQIVEIDERETALREPVNMVRLYNYFIEAKMEFLNEDFVQEVGFIRYTIILNEKTSPSGVIKYAIEKFANDPDFRGEVRPAITDNPYSLDVTGAGFEIFRLAGADENSPDIIQFKYVNRKIPQQIL